MNGLLAVLYIVGGMFGMMLSFYLLLLFIQWIADVIDEKRWQAKYEPIENLFPESISNILKDFPDLIKKH